MNNNLIISHRGIHNKKNIPENSLLSFKKSVEFKYPIELDINLTKDDVLVVFHDDNLKRMTGLNRNIKDMTYNEIKNLYLLNTKEKIPTLEEVLKLIDGKVLLIIEIKNNNRYKILINKLVNILNNYKGKYIIQSFDYRSILVLKNKYPYIKRGLLISGSNKHKLYRFFINTIIKICKIDFISISKKLLGNKKYDKYINKYPTFIWTIQSKEELDKYFGKYKGYICDKLPYNK